MSTESTLTAIRIVGLIVVVVGLAMLFYPLRRESAGKVASETHWKRPLCLYTNFQNPVIRAEDGLTETAFATGLRCHVRETVRAVATFVITAGTAETALRLRLRADSVNGVVHGDTLWHLPPNTNARVMCSWPIPSDGAETQPVLTAQWAANAPGNSVLLERLEIETVEATEKP